MTHFLAEGCLEDQELLLVSLYFFLRTIFDIEGLSEVLPGVTAHVHEFLLVVDIVVNLNVLRHLKFESVVASVVVDFLSRELVHCLVLES